MQDVPTNAVPPCFTLRGAGTGVTERCRNAALRRRGVAAVEKRAPSNILWCGWYVRQPLRAHRVPPPRAALNTFSNLTSESKGTHVPKDNPVTNIVLDGGAEGFGRGHTPKPPGSPVPGTQHLSIPCMQETLAEQNQTQPSLLSRACPADQASPFCSCSSGGGDSNPSPFSRFRF